MKPSKIFKAAISWLNTYLKIIAGGDIKTQRQRLIWMLPFAVFAPLAGILISWLVALFGLGAVSPIVVVVTFIIAIVPLVFMLWLAVALYVPLILFTIPAEYVGKLKELNASPENAKKIAYFFSDIIAWILFAGMYCYFWRVWNNILAVIPLIFVALFLFFSATGGWIEPNPKFKKKLWLAVIFLIFIPLTISFIQPTFYYHVFGRSPSGLSNKLPGSEKALEKLQKTAWDEKDQALAKSLENIQRLVKAGTISPDSGLVLAEKISQQIRERSLTNQAKNSISFLFKKNTPPPPTPSPTSSITQRDTLAVGTGWETVPQQLHVGNKIVFLSPRPNAKFKFDWQPESGAREVPLEKRADGMYWGFIEISAEPVDPNTRLQIKLGSSPSQGEKIVYWVA